MISSLVGSRRTRTPAALAAVLLASGIAACGGSGKPASSSPSSSSNSAPRTSSASAGLPDGVKSKGFFIVASDATYPPMESLAADGHTVVGFDADLANAIAAKLGISAHVMNANFDGILPGLQSGKYDLGMSAITDLKAREATFDFVTYFKAGTAFFTKTQGGATVTDLAGLCGVSVALEKGTLQVDDTSKQSKRCTSAGKPAVKQLIFPDQNGVNLALSSGRAQVAMADSPVAAYLVKRSGGQFKLTGSIYGTAPYGIAVAKDSGLAKPLLSAMKAVVSDGTYAGLLKKWGLQSASIGSPAINAAIS